jgi:putative nucleotidyltransferase with HDIG domain
MKKRILFVDDEPRVLHGLENLLVRYRHKWDMAFASGGPAALDEMRRAPVDVLVADMRMPVMDGATLLRIVKDEHPETVRIILSGHSEMELAMRAVPVAHQFLDKPCKPEVLEQVVERACSLHALVRDEKLRKVLGGLKKLPALPAAYSALERTLADERAGARELAQIIEQDIAMSAKILQLVNSAFFGLSRRVTSVPEAVSYLGFRMIQQLMLGAEIFADGGFASRPGMSLEGLRDHSLLTAAIARRILSDDRRAAEDAWTAGLLHDIGKLILAAELPEHLAAPVSVAQQTGRPAYEAEQQLYGVTHAEIGAYLVGMWGLPYSIVEAVGNHHAPERVPHPGLDVLTAVYVANALAHECEPDARAYQPPLNSDYLSSFGILDRIPGWRDDANELAFQVAGGRP